MLTIHYMRASLWSNACMDLLYDTMNNNTDSIYNVASITILTECWLNRMTMLGCWEHFHLILNCRQMNDFMMQGHHFSTLIYASILYLIYKKLRPPPSNFKINLINDRPWQDLVYVNVMIFMHYDYDRICLLWDFIVLI